MKRVILLLLTLGTLFPVLAEAVITRGYYWVDTKPPVEFTEPPTEIAVSDLNDGWHSLNVVANTSDGKYAVPVSSDFLKISVLNNQDLRAIAYIDGALTSEPAIKTLGEGNYICEIDMNRFAAGVHNLQIVFLTPTGSVSETMNTWFIRVPSESQLHSTSVAYFIDGLLSGMQTLNNNGVAYFADIDTEPLNTGVHSIDIALVLADGTMTPYQSAWFYKTPIPAGIASYEYWIDDDIDGIKHIGLDNVTADFSLVTMIDIPKLPFDSRNYSFSLNNGNPVIYGLHSLRMRFYESDGRASSQSSLFEDSRYPHTVKPLILNEGLTEVEKREDNEIKWYTFDGEVGDSIVLNMTRSAMYELYTPSGEKLLQKRGAQTEAETTATLRETGKYYFAAHDVVNDRTAPFGINFQHIPRNAILSVSPSSAVSDARFTLIDVFGNGMRDAKHLALKSADNVVFESDSVFAYDNYHLSAIIKPENKIPDGIYDVSMVVTDAVTGEEKAIVKKDAITVSSSTEKPNITVRVVPTRKAATPYMVDILVSNDSDSPCWGVPFNIACERNHGQNGFVFYMSDFLGDPMAASNITFYESDNIFGTGDDGVFFPLTLSYMKPRETRKLRVGIVAKPHAHVGLYAWAGTPYSEESRELLSMPADSLNAVQVPFTNIFDLRTAAYVACVLDETIWNAPEAKRADKNAVLKANSDDNRILEIAREYGPDAIGRYKPLERPSGYADKAANLAENYGRTEAGIVNAGAGYHCFNYFKNEEHIPGNTLGEQVRNIELLYPGAPESIPPGSLQIYYLQAKNTLGRGHSPQDIAEDAFGPEWYKLAKQFLCRNAESSNPMPTRNDIDVYMSGDPNDISGYVDPSGGNAIGCHVKTLNYEIEFENDPTLATVPASAINVTNTLDGKVFDLESFTPKELKIGSYTLALPALHNFVKTIDMRPERECIAEVRLDYSGETGKAQWTFNSLDPVTLQPIIDAREGLLPVNDTSGNGIGTITYEVALRDGLPHGTTVSNKATIVFDENDPIETPEWTNVTDYEFPSSKILGDQPYEGNAYQINVSLSDVGSGIMSYDLYAKASENDNWHVVKAGLSDSQIQFETPEPIEGISFMTLATDCAGNRQKSNDSGVTSGVAAVADENDIEVWYNTNGLRSNGPDTKTNGIIVSTKGRKIVVR